MKRTSFINLGFDLRKDYKYPVFLIAIVLFFFISPLFGFADNWFLTNIFYLIMILASLPIIQDRSALEKWGMILLAFIGVIVISLDFFLENSSFSGWSRVLIICLMTIYFVFLFKVLVLQVIRADEINFNVVFGAFTGYILLGILGYFLFRLVYILEPDSFHLDGDPFDSLIYYSFITLTTIGYGDISPILPTSRYLAILVGLVGQFYNVIILAFIVGKFLQSSPQNNKKTPGE